MFPMENIRSVLFGPFERGGRSILCVAALFLLCAAAPAQQIALSTNLTFTLSNGRTLSLRPGQMLQASGTGGYNWIVQYSAADTLLISADHAGEIHRGFSDRNTEQLYLEIAADLRERRIVATHARVSAILNQELADRDREAAVEELQNSLDRLERETRRLETTLQNLPRR